jgi:dihydrofolate synthase / folylpolyglutamate synthase
LTRPWSYAEAERHLESLELFGMRFGLERMQRLLTALGSPQHRFRSIHVVGTNGKSSTVRMTAEVLQHHGLRTGAYLSPHLGAWPERVLVTGAELEPEAFAAAVQRAARAAAVVERTLPADDRVTQFELLTAAAYGALAARGVDVAVVEAGLGGRYDATNVIPSEVQVLTNVGLEHTRWLGPTLTDIAREKLAVVRPGGTLVIGRLDPEPLREARAAAADKGARLVQAPPEPPVAPAAPGVFQRANFAVACAASQAFLGRLDPAAVRAAAESATVPGRFERIGQDPVTFLDGAHNPSGMAALVESLPGGETARLVAVLSILDDKDAAGMLAALLPRCAAAVFTSNSNPRALPPGTLASLARQVGFAGPVEIEPDPEAALARGRSLAGGSGMALATGSIYLVGDLRAEGARMRARAR